MTLQKKQEPAKKESHYAKSFLFQSILEVLLKIYFIYGMDWGVFLYKMLYFFPFQHLVYLENSVIDFEMIFASF